MKSYKQLRKDIDQRLAEIDKLPEAKAKQKVLSGLTREEQRLGSLAFYILMEINRNRTDDDKREVISELEDALQVTTDW